MNRHNLYHWHSCLDGTNTGSPLVRLPMSGHGQKSEIWQCFEAVGQVLSEIPWCCCHVSVQLLWMLNTQKIRLGNQLKIHLVKNQRTRSRWSHIVHTNICSTTEALQQASDSNIYFYAGSLNMFLFLTLYVWYLFWNISYCPPACHQMTSIASKKLSPIVGGLEWRLFWASNSISDHFPSLSKKIILLSL